MCRVEIVGAERTQLLATQRSAAQRHRLGRASASSELARHGKPPTHPATAGQLGSTEASPFVAPVAALIHRRAARRRIDHGRRGSIGEDLPRRGSRRTGAREPGAVGGWHWRALNPSPEPPCCRPTGSGDWLAPGRTRKPAPDRLRADRRRRAHRPPGIQPAPSHRHRSSLAPVQGPPRSPTTPPLARVGRALATSPPDESTRRI